MLFDPFWIVVFLNLLQSASETPVRIFESRTSLNSGLKSAIVNKLAIHGTINQFCKLCGLSAISSTPISLLYLTIARSGR